MAPAGSSPWRARCTSAARIAGSSAVESTCSNGYYRTAERMGVSFRYDAFVEDLLIENDRFEGL